MHYFWVQNLQKWFRNEIYHSTLLDPKRCLRVFPSILQTFQASNDQKLVFWPEFTISSYRTCENGFATKSTILPHWTPNDVLECFGAFRKPLEHKMKQNLSFGPQCTISGYRTCENGFVTKSTILPH